MKALHLLVSEKKNFEVCLFCSHVQTCDPRGRASLTPGASYVQTWLRSTRRCCIPNIKTLQLPVSEKMNFENGLLCSYVPTCDPGVGPVLTPGASYAQTW